MCLKIHGLKIHALAEGVKGSRGQGVKGATSAPLAEHHRLRLSDHPRHKGKINKRQEKQPHHLHEPKQKYKRGFLYI